MNFKATVDADVNLGTGTNPRGFAIALIVDPPEPQWPYYGISGGSTFDYDLVLEALVLTVDLGADQSSSSMFLSDTIANIAGEPPALPSFLGPVFTLEIEATIESGDVDLDVRFSSFGRLGDSTFDSGVASGLEAVLWSAFDGGDTFELSGPITVFDSLFVVPGDLVPR